MSVQLIIADYSQKSFVVFGEETKMYKEDFKRIGGKWNQNLTLNNTSIKGWIFSHKKKADIENFLEGLRKPPFADIVAPPAEIPKMAVQMCDKATQTEPQEEDEGLLDEAFHSMMMIGDESESESEYDRITNKWLAENLARIPNLPEKRVVINTASTAPKLDNTYFQCKCGIRVLRKNRFRHFASTSHKQVMEGVTSDELD